jgi:hypothetical protein
MTMSSPVMPDDLRGYVMAESFNPITREFTRFPSLARIGHEPGTVVVVVDDEGARRLPMDPPPTKAEVIRARYTRICRVDVSPHQHEFHWDLPARGDVWTFQAIVLVTCRVSDPVKVVTRSIKDVWPTLEPLLLQPLRQISRRFDVTEIDDAEQQLTGYLSDQEFPDVGLHIDEAFVTLKLEQTTADHLQRIGVIELDQQRLEQEARLKRMQAQHEQEVAEQREQHRRALEQERLNRYQKVLDDGILGLLALRLASHPEDLDPVINMMQQERERFTNHEGVIKKEPSLPSPDGGMELALRLRFGEPGEHVALADSSKLLAKLDSVWAHCANVVRPIDSDLPQEGVEDSLSPTPAGSGVPSDSRKGARGATDVADTESPSAGSDTDTTSVPPLQVRISHGSLLLELLQSGSDWWAVQAMAVTTFAIKVGPTLAGLPPEMQKRWYMNKAAAERAKQDLIAIRGQLALEAPKSSSPSLESHDQETSGGQHA